MNDYTITQLADSQTYQDDPDLHEFCRKLAGSIRQLFPFGTDVVALLLSGQEAERVHKSWQKRRAKWLLETEQRRRNISETENVLDEVSQLQLPDGVTVVLGNPDEILLTIPRDGGLMTPKIKRIGGWWDVNRCRFVVPVSAAGSLPRILRNWSRAYNKKSAEMRQAKQAKIARRAEWQREREARWATERVQAARARANRERVVAGQYQIGDEIRGRKIKSFGKSWTVREPDYKKWNGTRYQEHCGGCGRYSDEIENDSDLCPRCFPHQITKTVCYAYFV